MYAASSRSVTPHNNLHGTCQPLPASFLLLPNLANTTQNLVVQSADLPPERAWLLKGQANYPCVGGGLKRKLKFSEMNLSTAL